jgi:hypothetical protein
LRLFYLPGAEKEYITDKFIVAAKSVKDLNESEENCLDEFLRDTSL